MFATPEIQVQEPTEDQFGALASISLPKQRWAFEVSGFAWGLTRKPKPSKARLRVFCAKSSMRSNLAVFFFPSASSAFHIFPSPGVRLGALVAFIHSLQPSFPHLPPPKKKQSKTKHTRQHQGFILNDPRLAAGSDSICKRQVVLAQKESVWFGCLPPTPSFFQDFSVTNIGSFIA